MGDKISIFFILLVFPVLLSFFLRLHQSLFDVVKVVIEIVDSIILDVVRWMLGGPVSFNDRLSSKIELYELLELIVVTSSTIGEPVDSNSLQVKTYPES